MTIEYVGKINHTTGDISIKQKVIKKPPFLLLWQKVAIVLTWLISFWAMGSS